MEIEVKIIYSSELIDALYRRIADEGIISAWADTRECALGIEYWEKEAIAAIDAQGKERPPAQIITVTTLIGIIGTAFANANFNDFNWQIAICVLLKDVSSEQLRSDNIDFALQTTLFGEVKYV